MRGLISIAALMLAGLVYAQDGALEINQACVAEGCFSGDTAGFPVRITNPGAYRLTSNLDTQGELVRAISISNVDGVDLDLNGFTVSGPQTCQYDQSTEEVMCSIREDFGLGLIRVFGRNHTIRNGRVTGGLSRGISLSGTTGGPHLIENVHFSENGQRPTFASGDGSITEGQGIDVASNVSALVRNCTSSLTNTGFRGSEHTRFEGNLIFETQTYGIRVGNCSGNTVAKSGPPAPYRDCVDLGGNTPTP